MSGKIERIEKKNQPDILGPRAWMGIFFSPMFIICYTKPKIWEHSGLQTCLLFPLQSFHIALVLHKLIIHKSCGEPPVLYTVGF